MNDHGVAPLLPQFFWDPSKIEVKIKEMISEDVVIKIMIIRYLLPPFSRFWKVGVLFVWGFFGLSRLFGRIWPLLSKTRLSILSMIILILFFKIKFTTRLVFVNN